MRSQEDHDPGNDRRRGTALIVTPRFLPFLGGLEEECALLAKEFEDLGYTSRVLTEELGAGLPFSETVGGTRVRRIRSSPSRTVVTQLWVAAVLAVHLLRFRGEVSFAIVRSYTLPALVVGLMKRLKLLNFPTVVFADTGGADDDIVALERRRWPALSRLLVQGNSAFVGLCEANIKHLRAAGYPPDRVHLIPNGIDVQPWLSSSPPGNVRKFGYLGRLDEEKGLLELCDAAESLVASHPDVSIIIAGEGPLEETLVRRIADSNLDDHVQLVGRIEHSMIGAFFEDVDCLVLPSYSESFGLSAFEAAAHHRALVLSDVGDLRRYFGGEAHFCQPRDVLSLRSALEEALQTEPPRTDYQDVLNLVSIDRVAKQIIDIADTAGQGARPRESF